MAQRCCLHQNSNLGGSGISLPVFPSRTNLKPYNISGHNEPWFVGVLWSWLYSNSGSKELLAWTFLHTSAARVSHSGGHGGNPHETPPPIKTDASMGCNLCLKMKHLPLKNKAPFQKRIPRKKTQNRKLSLILVFHSKKQHWKKMTAIPQKRDFLTWSI